MFNFWLSFKVSQHHEKPSISLFYFINLFYWTIVDLQCCVHLCCTAKWLRYTYTYVYIYVYTHTHTHTHTHTRVLFSILFHYGLSQKMGYSSLCYIVGLCLFILCIVIWTANPDLSIFPSLIPLYPLATTSLFPMWVCICFIYKFTCMIFRFHM